MTLGSHILKTTILSERDLEKSYSITNSEFMILILLNHASGIQK